MTLQILGEFLGTFILVLLGNGVVAANVLGKTKSENAGWVTIAIGWGLAVAVAVWVVGFFSPAYLNPALVIGFLVLGKIKIGLALAFIVAEFLGAMLGAVAVWLHYYPHWEETKDSSLILASFATAPAIRYSWSNFLGEAFDGALLMLLIMAMGHYRLEGGFGTIIIGFLIMAVGFSLGPTTGYAMNPARDLGPRIMHALLPIKNKGTSGWGYAWIPATGSIVGAVIAGLLYQWMLTLH